MAKKKYHCFVCGADVAKARVDALADFGISPENVTCLAHSTVRAKKGIYLGEVGTSELLLVSKVYDDSVRSVFRKAKKDSEAEIDDTNDTVEKDSYNDKELNYYNSNDEQTDPEEKIEIIKRQQP